MTVIPKILQDCILHCARLQSGMFDLEIVIQTDTMVLLNGFRALLERLVFGDLPWRVFSVVALVHFQQGRSWEVQSSIKLPLLKTSSVDVLLRRSWGRRFEIGGLSVSLRC